MLLSQGCIFRDHREYIAESGCIFGKLFTTVAQRNGRFFLFLPWDGWFVHQCILRIILPSTLVIRSLQLDISLACSSGYIYCKLPLTSVSGSVFAIYTSLPWFIYNIYTCYLLVSIYLIYMSILCTLTYMKQTLFISVCCFFSIEIL